MFHHFRSLEKVFTISFDDYKSVIHEESKGIKVGLILDYLRKSMVIRGEDDLKKIFKEVDVD